MNNTYGSVRPSIVDIENDVEIFYHYRPTRNSDDEAFSDFRKVSDVSSMLSVSKVESGGSIVDNDLRLPGMYNLSLPVSVFSQVGFYTIYIKPKEIKATIMDIGVLAAYTDINGIVIDLNVQSEQKELFNSDNLNGYRIDYYKDDGNGLRRQDYYRIITGCNKCEPISQNLSSSNTNSNGYRFNSTGSLCFITVTPNSSPSYKAGSNPYIGEPNQTISISNTKFDPVMIEVEICRHDIETLNTAIDGNQIRSLDNGLVTTYNENGEIYSQKEYISVKNSYTQNDSYEAKIDRTGNIEFSPNYDEIIRQ